MYFRLPVRLLNNLINSPKAVIFQRKNYLPRVGLEPTIVHFSAMLLSYRGNSAGCAELHVYIGRSLLKFIHSGCGLFCLVMRSLPFLTPAIHTLPVSYHPPPPHTLHPPPLSTSHHPPSSTLYLTPSTLHLLPRPPLPVTIHSSLEHMIKLYECGL